MKAKQLNFSFFKFCCFPYRDVKPITVLENVAVLGQVKKTPFFVLPNASHALGRSLGVKRIAALGFRKQEVVLSQEGTKLTGGEDDAAAVVDIATRLKSFRQFILQKKDFLNCRFF